MDPAVIHQKLVGVLQIIQQSSGLDCPDIKGSTKPVADLEKFDSKIWPVAIGMLSIELGVVIPEDLNIFRKKGTNVPMTVDEIVKCVAAELSKSNPATI